MKVVGFVGAGLIGNERIKAFAALAAEDRALRAVGVVDPLQSKVAERAAIAGAPVLESVETLIDARPDVVIVAVPHDTAQEISGAFLRVGVRVLLEKPIGRTLDEAKSLAARQRYPGQLLIGHNYRFFRGIAALFEDLRRGLFGLPISLAFVLGHGGSPGDVRSWKLDPIRAGGGCLIDPGIHLLDLACQAEGEALEVRGGNHWSGFWRTGIEEDCHLILKGRTIPTVTIDVSIVRWRNTFRMELIGTEGYGVVEGRGRSYGPQTYRRGRRWGWQSGRSQAETEEVVVTTSGDSVFVDELRAILYQGDRSRPSVATADEALVAMALLHDCRRKLDLPDHVG
jgi:predicted dehydrogenase